jgi:predicted O-linked N-acetylglucosamine transferase (SPINDLY family)
MLRDFVRNLLAGMGRGGTSGDAMRDAGFAAMRDGRLDEAVDLLSRAAALDSGNAELRKKLGDALRLSWRMQEAVQSYRQAIVLDPGYVDARNNLGVVLGGLGSRAEAIECFQAAIALDPAHAEAHINLGNVLREAGRFDEAVASYREATRANPGHVLAYSNLAELYRDLGRFEDARACDDRILALDPNDATLIKRAISIPVVAGSRDEIARIRDGLRQSVAGLIERGVRLLDPLEQIGQTSFLLPYHGENDRELQCLLAKLYEQACPSLRYVAPHCTPAHRMPARRRVGFLSRHFFGHSVAAWFSALIDRLAADGAVDPVLITVGPAESAVLQRAFPSVREHLQLPYDLPAARGMIAELKLDILMYTDIGMEPLSYFLAFSRLAPIQCSMWGHPVTSGIPNIDYFVSSSLIEPEGAAAHYSETLISLDALPAYIERPALPVSPKSRAALGLPQDRHLYACPTMLQKLHPDFDLAIAGILRRDPVAEILLFRDSRFAHWHEKVLERLTASIPDVVHRVRFLPWLSPDDLMSVLMAADVVLDTFHFGAATTTFLVLATGTPIVTLPAAYARGRATLGLYRKIGVMDCVASTPEEYVDLAVRIAADKECRNRLRARILERCGTLYRDADLVSQMTAMLLRLDRKG